MSAEYAPPGERTEAVTFRVTDRHGLILGQGLKSEALADALAEQLARDPAYGPITVARVTFVGFKNVEPLRQVEPPPPPEPHPEAQP